MFDVQEELTRRACVKRIAASAVVMGATGGVVPARAQERSRQVLVFSDIHIGHIADGVDGSEWMARALKELRENQIRVDYAMALGDIAHHANADAFKAYKQLKKQSGIETWFELAGNHEYGKEGLEDYEAVVRSAKPYAHIDGNLAWFVISDEAKGVPGNISDETFDWLKKAIAENQDKIVIVCSHQLVHNTIRKSEDAQRYIHPKEKIAEMLKAYRVDLWMCGHEHHRPYSKQEIRRVNNTTFINVASMSHAYGSKESQSFLLQFKQGAKSIVARRRVHDRQEFSIDFETEIPLDREIDLAPTQETF